MISRIVSVETFAARYPVIGHFKFLPSSTSARPTRDTVMVKICDDAGNFDYIAGVEVSDFSDLPREFSTVRIPEQRYAVFSHREHISTIRRTINTIWNHWLPISGMKAADAPSFERYDENFDPLTGNGGLEIWVPVRE